MEIELQSLIANEMGKFLTIIISNTTSPALRGGKLDCCASGIDLHRKWVRGTL